MRVTRQTSCLAFVGCLLASPAFAQTGDLVYSRGWYAETENLDGWDTYVDLWMGDDYGLLDSDSDPQFAEVSAEIPARSVHNTAWAQADYWVETPWSGWEYYASLYDTSALPGAGPANVPIFAKTFIKDNWLGHPYWLPFIYGGDDRGFSYYGGSSRTWLYAEVENSATGSGSWIWGPEGGADLSMQYDRDSSLTMGAFGGVLTQAAKDDWEWGGDKKTAWDTASVDYYCSTPELLGDMYGFETSSVEFDCHFDGSNPLVNFSPQINVEFTVRLTFGNDSVQYTVEGGWDGFPSVELYLNSHPVVQEHDNGDVWSLLGGASTPFYATGGF